MYPARLKLIWANRDRPAAASRRSEDLKVWLPLLAVRRTEANGSGYASVHLGGGGAGITIMVAPGIPATVAARLAATSAAMPSAGIVTGTAEGNAALVATGVAGGVAAGAAAGAGSPSFQLGRCHEIIEEARCFLCARQCQWPK